MSSLSAATILIVAGAIAVAWAAGRLAHRLGQPPVVGGLAAGIALGPSVFGLITPNLFARVFTADAAAVIAVIATGAVLVFMFLAGLELDVSLLRRHARGVLQIAAASLVVPFAIGCALAAWILPSLAGPAATPLTFTLFLGIAFAITAMPVLARILVDLRMLQTTTGTIAMGCAAINDVAAWTLLGIVVSLVRGESAIVSTLVMTVAYVSVMILAVRPFLKAAARYRTRPGGTAMWMALVLTLAALSAFVTASIGLHAVFGAFFLGACVPRGTDALAGLERPMQRVSAILLPAFFIVTGLKTDVASAGIATGWTTVVILACAVAGKLGGSALAARGVGLAWRDALVIGALLNTRGLVELVALDIGRSLSVISPQLFTMLVVMTFVTAFSTAPLVRWLKKRPRSNTGPA